jgi:hypothetical protein
MGAFQLLMHDLVPWSRIAWLSHLHQPRPHYLDLCITEPRLLRRLIGLLTCAIAETQPRGLVSPDWSAGHHERISFRSKDPAAGAPGAGHLGGDWRWSAWNRRCRRAGRNSATTSAVRGVKPLPAPVAYPCRYVAIDAALIGMVHPIRASYQAGSASPVVVSEGLRRLPGTTATMT